MRKCENCGGPGPCLHDDSEQQYLCKKCHSTPSDPFFVGNKEEPKRPVDLDFWEWIKMVHPQMDEPPEHIKRMWDFFSGQSTEDVKLVLASPRRTKTYNLINARMLTKPWENHRVEPGADITVDECTTELVRFDGQVQVHVDDLVETYPDDLKVMESVAKHMEDDKEKAIDYLLRKKEHGGQSGSVELTPLSPDVVPSHSAGPPDIESLPVTEEEKENRVARFKVKVPEADYREMAAVLFGGSVKIYNPITEEWVDGEVGPVSKPCDWNPSGPIHDDGPTEGEDDEDKDRADKHKC